MGVADDEVESQAHVDANLLAQDIDYVSKAGGLQPLVPLFCLSNGLFVPVFALHLGFTVKYCA